MFSVPSAQQKKVIPFDLSDVVYVSRGERVNVENRKTFAIQIKNYFGWQSAFFFQNQRTRRVRSATCFDKRHEANADGLLCRHLTVIPFLHCHQILVAVNWSDWDDHRASRS